MRWSAEVLLMSLLTVAVATVIAFDPNLAIFSNLIGWHFNLWHAERGQNVGMASSLALLALAILLPIIFRDSLRPAVTYSCGLAVTLGCTILALLAGSSLESAFLAVSFGVVGLMRGQILGPISTRRINEEMLGKSFLQSPNAMLLVDRGGTVVFSNKMAQQLAGYLPEKHPVERLLPDLGWPDHFERSKRNPSRIEHILVRESLDKMAVEIATTGLDHPSSELVILQITDRTEDQRRIAELTEMALRDPLTGLANRALFDDRMTQSLAVAERQGSQLAILLLDLDKFKQVNDTLGHHVGDLLLQQVGPRLEEPLRKSDTLARLGGDEFSIILSQSPSLDQACNIAERIVERLAEPFEIEGMSLEIGTSIGVALFPEHGTNAIALLKNADSAMYKAKREKLGFCVFDSEDRVSNLRRVSLQRGLRAAIDNNELLLFLQPKLHAGTREMVGCEALVRWQHPKFGTLSPDEFLPIAEQTGLIMPLTLWVFNACLKAQERWRQSGLDIQVAINLSPRWLADKSFPKILQLLLHNWQGKPDRFVLEVTEQAINNDPATAMAVMRGLSDIGCRISLDDFGTGYSSLGNLQSLPIDELKIDKSFVANMSEDENAAIVVRSIVKLAHALGLKVVAEGVESEKIADYLTSMGCDILQGYYIGKPATLTEFDQWLLGGGTLLQQLEDADF